MKIRICRVILCLFLVQCLGGCTFVSPLPHTPESSDAVPVLATPPPAITPTPEPTLVPVESVLPTPIPYKPPEGAFAPDDLTMMAIDLNSGMDEVVAELGLPDFSEEEISETTGVRTVTLAYDNLYISMKGGASPATLHINALTITSPAWPGPRDLRVGAALKDVLTAFTLILPEESESEDEEKQAVTVLYADEQPDGRTLPPLAELAHDVNENGAYVLRMIAPLERYAELDKQEDGYFSINHAGCTFYFDVENDALVRIHWFVGPLVDTE